MRRETVRSAALLLTLTIFLGSCASRPEESIPVATSNTSGTTTVNGIEVPYQYDGESYIIGGDMGFSSLQNLRSFVGDPFATDDGFIPAQAEEDGFFYKGFQWPDARIPFQITAYSSGTNEYAQVTNALAYWEQMTSVRFYPSSTNSARLVIRKVTGGGCGGITSVGYAAGQDNYIKLFSGCNSDSDAASRRMKLVVRHEIGHAVGMFHEHQRTDRDNHVDPTLDNAIDPGAFAKIFNVGVTYTGYDFDSLMHYGRTEGSKSPTLPVLERLSDRNYPLGSDFLTSADVYSVERYYAGQNPCGRSSYPANCRRVGSGLSSTDPVDNSTNVDISKDNVVLAGWMISDDFSSSGLSYRLELQKESPLTASWTTIAQSTIGTGGYVSLSRTVDAGSYRWIYRRTSGAGYYDAYRTNSP